MKKIILVLSVFALFFAVSIEAAHACGETGAQELVHVDSDGTDNPEHQSDDCCEEFCGSCCVHHISSFSSKAFISPIGIEKNVFSDPDIHIYSIAYNLKRPPKHSS